MHAELKIFYFLYYFITILLIYNKGIDFNPRSCSARLLTGAWLAFYLISNQFS